MLNRPRTLLPFILLTLLVVACSAPQAVLQPTGSAAAPATQPLVAPTTLGATTRLPGVTPTYTATSQVTVTLSATPAPRLPPTTAPTFVPVSTSTLAALPPTTAPTAPVTPTSSAPVLLEERQIGAYTVRLWQPAWGTGMYNHATLTTPGQPEIRVEAVTAIGSQPVEDVTADGVPEVVFETYAGGSHCCSGTVVYNLGPAPDKVLDILSPPGYYGTGSGTFQDLDGDQVYEFVTRDPLAGIPCTAPSVRVILQYVPGQGYRGASPRFPAAYAEDIAAHTLGAEQEIELSRDGYKCGVYELILDYLYSGQTDRARQELERLYLGPDLEEFWSQLQQAASAGRFYAAP